MPKSRLQAALARDKEVDFQLLKQKKKAKLRAVERAKRESESRRNDDDEEEEEDKDEDEGENDKEVPKLVKAQDEDEEEDEDEDDEGGGVKFQIPEDETSSESEIGESNAKEEDDDEDEEEDDEDDEDEEIDMEDIEDELDEDEDVVPRPRVTINNSSALLTCLRRIAIVDSSTASTAPFAAHQSVCDASQPPTESRIPDVADDMNRELQFLAQALHAARVGRKKLLKEGVPFSRPNDYFAEMLRPEAVMDKVKAKLIEDATAKKAAAEARKLRDLKKFGKQVQVAKMQERAKEKRETLDKIKTLKRKRQDGSSAGVTSTEADDLFDVAVDKELGGSKKRSAGAAGHRDSRDRQPNAKRQRKDAKYGFGGKKRHAKSGDAVSSGDMSGFSARRMKGKGGDSAAGGSRGGFGGGKAKAKVPRLGKSRRKAIAGKR